MMKKFINRVSNALNYERDFNNEPLYFKVFVVFCFCFRVVAIIIYCVLCFLTVPIWIVPYMVWYCIKHEKE